MQPDKTQTVWCPRCSAGVELSDVNLHVTFTPVAAKLSPDGSLDMGTFGDYFMDYDHLECGTHVRLVSNAEWDEAMAEYLPARAFVELTIDGEYVSDGNELMFSSSTDTAPETWGATYVVLLEHLRTALSRLEERMETE